VIGSRTKDTVEALSSIRTEIVMMDIGLMEILKERAE
jgi:chorismate mutase